MHSPATINLLEQRRADNAEAQRILKEHGDNTTQVIGGGSGEAQFDVPHNAESGTKVG